MPSVKGLLRQAKTTFHQRVLRRDPPQVRDRLFDLLPEGSVGAEVGVWRGDFSARLVQRLRPRTLHLVDPWAFQADERHDGAWYAGAWAKSQADMDKVYEGVVQRFADRPEVVIHRARSTDAAREIPDGSVDWVYIDGDHLYEAVLADLAAWSPKLVAGGFLCGDDYGDPGWWQDGVTRAVDEFVEQTGWEPVFRQTHLFAVRAPGGGG